MDNGCLIGQGVAHWTMGASSDKSDRSDKSDESDTRTPSATYWGSDSSDLSDLSDKAPSKQELLSNSPKAVK